MKTIEYKDNNGYGTVHAKSIIIYVYGSLPHIAPVNPMCLISPRGIYYFGTNTVLFQID